MQKLLFIANPHTGGGRLKNNLLAVLQTFHEAGYETTVHLTTGKGDARRRAADCAGYQRVVCCGGDGTLNEVVNGLMKADGPPPLGYIPGGTTNDFATSLKIPKSQMVAAAQRAIKPNKKFRCDLGQLNDRYFTYVAAFGAFTDVSYSTPQPMKNALGYFGYIIEGLQQLPKLPSHKVRVTTNRLLEEEFLFGMVTNSLSVGGFGNFGKDKVLLDDGQFEVLLVRRPHSLAELGGLSAALIARDQSSPYIESMCTDKIRFHCDEAIPWTVDGEYGGQTKDTTVKVHRQAFTICI